MSDTAIAYFRQQIARNQQQVAAGTAALGGSRGIVIFDIGKLLQIPDLTFACRAYSLGRHPTATSTASFMPHFSPQTRAHLTPFYSSSYLLFIPMGLFLDLLRV